MQQPSAGADARWATDRPFMRRPRRLLLSAVFLVYLLYVGLAVADHSHGAAAVAGYVILGAFCVAYMVFAAQAPSLTAARFWALVAILLALFVAELPYARAAAFIMCVHITAIVVGRLGLRATPIVIVLALCALLVPTAIPAWHDSFGDAVDTVTPIAIPVVALASLALVQLVQANVALAQARAELARLSAENERTRIARDLHDLLGHSLTTITVKAGLAHRVGALDHDRAMREVAEIELLARRSLSDVRAAVSSYREVTLTGELATGRAVLRAAGIAAELPSAVDVVDPAHHELFGWVVREGLTNVVRHARASSCTVTLSASSVEILDDGVGGAAGPGNGLVGLRERVVTAGGSVQAGSGPSGGWRLRVSLDGERPA